MPGQGDQLGDLLADLIGVGGERDGLEDRLQALPLALFHLLQFLEVGEIGRGGAARARGLSAWAAARVLWRFTERMTVR